MNIDDLAKLFKDYQHLVYRTAFLIFGSHEEAEDALQDVFLKIYQSYGTYDPDKGAFSTWIHQITVNHCLKRKTRFLWRFLPLHKEPEMHPLRSSIEDEKDLHLFDALSHLTSDQRSLVALRYGWQLPYEEIAQILGVPLGTVKSRHSRVIKILQAYYLKDELPALLEKEIK